MLATPELLRQEALSLGLREVLTRSAREIPLYGQVAVEPKADEPPAGQLQRWPLITKEDIRRSFPANFLGEKVQLEALLDDEVIELEHTSGTSEQRTPLLLPRGWWAEQELRALNLNALAAQVLAKNSDARRATINSPVCSSDIRYQGVPSRADRVVGNSLFVSLSRYPFLWNERELARMAEEIMDWNPEFLDVDPVYGVVFALYCEQNRIRFPRVQFVICSYEYLSLVHRAILQRAWQVPVFDLYGSTETGHLLMEDTAGQMRPSFETAFLEVLNPDSGGIGDLVVTTLTNSYMPLIRYRIGDLVEHFETPYGMRYRVHGRTADAFLTPGNRRVTIRQLDHCVARIDGVAHYQLLQRPQGSWTLRFVPDHQPPDQPRLAGLAKELADLLHSDGPVLIEKTDMLSPERSGKFRLGYPIHTGTHRIRELS